MRPLDDAVIRISSRQHGDITRGQLLGAGMSPDAIKRRIAKGALLPEFPGVYRVGHRAPSLEARYLAAVLACGEGALLGGLAAAFLFCLIRGQAPRPVVLTRNRRQIRGIETHRTRARSTDYNRIPVASVPDVLVQIAAALTTGDLARACHEAGVRYRTTPRQVDAVLRPNAPGAAKLRRVLRGDEHVSLSKLERRFLELLIEAGLPLPRTNKVASGRRVDCRWAEYGLTVELNGYLYHGSRHAWEMDHRRAREAYARGDEFRSYTYADVFESPELMLAELGRLLS